MRNSVLVAALLLGAPLMALAPLSNAHAAKKKDDKISKKEGIITWNVQPADVVIYVDGKKVGTAGSAKPHKVKAGMHIIRLVWGKDEREDPIEVTAAKSVEYQYTFEDSGKDKQPTPGEP